MANIEQVTQAAKVFLQCILPAEDAKVVKITKTPEGWEEEVEVYEESSFIKSIGLPTRVRDRNVYKVRVNENLEVESYERTTANPQPQA